MLPTNIITLRFGDFFDQVVKNEAHENEIRGFLSANQFLMYFKFYDKNTKKNQIYGSKEDDRIAYSIMKKPKKDDVLDNYEYFGGINLEAALKDPTNMHQRLFTKEDIVNINIIENINDVIKTLSKIKNTSPEIPVNISSGKTIIIDKND